LARERSTMADHQVGRVGDEPAERLDAVRRAELVVGAGVDAPLPEVPVERAVVAVAVEQGPELAQVAGELGRGHGGVLPTFVRRGLAGDERGGAETRFAELPELRLLR